MKKLSKKLTLSITSLVVSISAGLAVAFPIANNLTKNSSISNISSQNQSTDVSPIIPSEVNDQNSNLSTTNGPITFIGNTITALDWYGNKLWDKDLSKEIPDKNGNKYNGSNRVDYKDGSWNRSWFNWDYNRNTNLLWVLGFWSKANKKQPLFGINASTGEIVHKTEINYSQYNGLTSVTATSAYRFVSALSSGKVMVYGGAGSSYDARGLLYDPKTSEVSLIKGDSATTDILPMNRTDYGSNYKWYFFNLIPVGDNKNIVEVVNYARGSNLSGDSGKNLANYNVYFLLVDDKLNMITKDPNSKWSKPIEVAQGMENYRNTKVTPQRDYYSMLDGKVVTVVYNTAIVIDAKNSDVKFGSYPMSQVKWIKSWAFDSNQNLYFKFKDDTKIYKVSGNVWETLNNTESSDKVSPNTYLDLNGITTNNVQKYANNLIMYNVYGYTGQLMMINSKYNENVNLDNSGITVDSNSEKYGLAFAVTQNANDQNKGDYKGVLNGTDSIQKASNFQLNESARKSKIPSEITKNDIETLNNSFLKDSTDFNIKSMDDEKGTITIECKLYQIPWFSATLPRDITPRTIEHTYTTENKINNKISWKTLSTSTDYDFMNMRPTKIKADDVQNLDPFQVSFQSQIVTDNKGNQLYPKKTYSVSDQNDNTGTIKVIVKYEYVPMGLSFTQANVKSYTTSNVYNVFKSSETPKFQFVGQTNNSSSVNVTNVAELKNLLSANTLPSSFSNLNTSTDSTNSGFLKFVDTNASKGYPISKMKFTVTANDESGTLQINATMPQDYSPNSKVETFTIKYTNLNQSKNYKFAFKTPTNIDKQNLSSILPSAITDGDIINNFISYTGFSSNDFTITKNANDDKGTLSVSISLDSSYSSELGNGSVGFKNYIATSTFSGFMTKDQYNKRFDVQFYDDSDSKLMYLKQMQVSEIFNKLNDANGTPIGLTVNGVTYKNLKELIKNLLVKNKGTMVPDDWSDSSIIATMYYDNSQGTISFYVKIPQSKLNGSNSDLNLVVNYSGFVKGNITSTDDNLSFVANNMLKSYLISNGDIKEEEFNKFTPSTFANWLKENDNEKALELISYKSGQYVELLKNSSNYTLTIVPNDVQRNVAIYINFKGVTNNQSLSEYSVTYTI